MDNTLGPNRETLDERIVPDNANGIPVENNGTPGTKCPTETAESAFGGFVGKVNDLIRSATYIADR